MRLRMSIVDDLAKQAGLCAGQGQHDAFVTETVHRALDDERRWDDIEASLGALARREHEWDRDPATWVHAQRFADLSRVG